ncbi:BTAD domain-containing putative transcriptional regulator [Streptomyces sp. NPDC001156]
MRYRILGVAQVEDERGVPLPLGGPRVRTLLTALALRPGRTTARGTLIDEVWADDPPLDAPAALQALVGRLRRAVGREAVDSEPGGYRLVADREAVDLFVFEDLVQRGTSALARGEADTAARDLREALALWHGPALADLADRGAAARPEALRLTATRARVEADLCLGRAPDVVPELTELTAAHPYDEPLHTLLIRALRATGRGAEALAAYESVRRALAEGLGTDPGAELQALHAELLSQQPSTPTPSPAHGAPAPASSRAVRTGNLRPRLNSFVGREPELDAIRSDVRTARLVTLTGPGGSGKTRLAEEAAAGLPQAWLAELAPLDRPEAVPAAVVSALGLRETVLITNEMAMPQDDPVALLIEYCAPRNELLILDNCEHVIDAAAELAETLLTHCPGLTILATSREPLGVPGEAVRPVEPLPPDPARRLFLERAAAVRPDAHAVHDQAAVDEICRRLDGLPLAIELAAARLRMLTPRQIADRLDDRFRLLTSGSRTVLPRQQTLRAVVDWSWDLLDERERNVLREVSVFAGGWDLAAAEAVCTGSAAELIGSLVDKSLIVATPYEGDGSAGMRYRMLETIHEYATERAAEEPELRAAAERRHRAWVRALVEEADPKLRSAEQLPWIGRLETELDNIRAGLHRSIVAGDEAEAGAIVLATGWFWWLRNFRREGTESTDLVLRLAAALDARTAHDRATPLPVAAGSAAEPRLRTHGSASTARPVADVFEELGAVDPVHAFLADSDAEERHPLHPLRMKLRLLHMFLLSESRPADSMRDERSQRYVARVRAWFERGGADAACLPGIVWPLTVYYLGESYDVRHAMNATLANCRKYGGDWETGVALMLRTHVLVDSAGGLHGVNDDIAELRVISRRVGDRWMRAQVSSAAAEAAMGRGAFEEAKGEYEEALRLAHEVGAYAETPFLLARLGEITYREGKRADASTALDEATDAADRYGVQDARAFVSLLRAHMALDDGETAGARDWRERARAEAARGTPPPQFTAALNGVDALVTIAESGPRSGLPKLAEGLRQALVSGCAESVTAGLLEMAANVLGSMGAHSCAVRLFGAADHWRGASVRPEPERTRAERTQAAALEALGPARFGAERAKGAAFTADDVLRELARAATE